MSNVEKKEWQINTNDVEANESWMFIIESVNEVACAIRAFTMTS